MRAFGYFALILALHHAAFPLTGVVNYLIHRAYLNQRAERVLHSIHFFIRWEGVWKLFLWAVGSFGSIAGYLIATRLWGVPSRPVEWWAVFLAAALIFMSRVHAIYSFEFFDIADVFGPEDKTTIPRFFLRHIRPAARRVAAADASAAMFTFLLSVCFHAILQLLASFSLLILAAANLRIVETIGSPITLGDALVLSFSSIGAAAGDTPRLIGPVWLGLRMALGVTVLVWAVAFVAFAMSALPRSAELRELARGKNDGTEPRVSPDPENQQHDESAPRES